MATGVNTPRWRSFMRVLQAACLAITPDVASAQAPTIAPEVVFSASGGISKGAYQGGVDWTISEFLRRQRVDSLRETLLIEHKTRFDLKSATGASAGNINALFVALGWCTSRLNGPRVRDNTQHPAEIAAEDSLFWQAWIPTGLTELSHDWKRTGLARPRPLRRAKSRPARSAGTCFRPLTSPRCAILCSAPSPTWRLRSSTALLSARALCQSD